MFAWLKRLFKSKHSKSVLLSPIGYNAGELIQAVKDTKHTDECLCCGAKWVSKTYKMYDINKTIQLYQNCSNCLNITKLEPKNISITGKGQNLAIKIKEAAE